MPIVLLDKRTLATVLYKISMQKAISYTLQRKCHTPAKVRLALSQGASSGVIR